MDSATRKALSVVVSGNGSLDRTLTAIVCGQVAICVVCCLYCLVTRYTHHQKLLYTLLCAVAVTTATAIAATNRRQSQSVIAGLFLICAFVGYAFLHIVSREWVFPLHMDNIHDYEI